MKLPAGMMDRDVEFFMHNGELMVLSDSKIKSFDSMPASVKYYLEDLLANDDDANFCLDCMDISDHLERLRQFVFCRFSSFDLVADITEGGHMSPEFTICEKRGRCPYEGTLCVSAIHHSKLSSREIEVIVMIAKDLPNKLIADELDISTNTVNTHVQNIQSKIGVHSKYGILAWAFKHNIIDEQLINNCSLWKTEGKGGIVTGDSQGPGAPPAPGLFKP